MQQLPLLLVLASFLALACTAAHAQLPPLQPFEPLQPLQPMQPMQPFRPLAPLPPMKPLPGFAPFPQMEMPPFPSFGAATGGGGGPAGRYSASSSSSASSFGGGGRASTTPGCTVLQETSGESQAGSSKAGSTSCSLSQRVEVCSSSKPGARGHTRAVATINGQPSTCCVVLLKLPARTPQLFCAAPNRGKTYSRIPAVGTSIDLKPECSSSTSDGTAGSLSCTVTFEKLPEGFTYPAGNTAASPLVLHRGEGAAPPTSGSTTSGTTSSSSGAKPSSATGPGSNSRPPFVPCNNRQFSKFMQATSRTLPGGGVVLTSKCD